MNVARMPGEVAGRGDIFQYFLVFLDAHSQWSASALALPVALSVALHCHCQ